MDYRLWSLIKILENLWNSVIKINFYSTKTYLYIYNLTEIHLFKPLIFLN